MTSQIAHLFLVCLGLCFVCTYAKKPFTEEDCEVCVKVLDRFMKESPEELRKKITSGHRNWPEEVLQRFKGQLQGG